MSEIKLNCCDYPEDELTINTAITDQVYVGVRCHYEDNPLSECGVYLNLESVNKIQQIIEEWKEINGHE